jgi:hypothetical protein
MTDTRSYTDLEQLKHIVSVTDYRKEPFLFHLPTLLTHKALSSIKPEQAIRFATLALKHERPVIIHDAIKILNRTINPEDGSFKEASTNMFYENQSFFWRDLGEHTKITDIILHVFNKTLFEIMVGQYT